MNTLSFTYTFLYNSSSIVFIIFFFGARGPGSYLLSAAHVQDGHAGGHAHTSGKTSAGDILRKSQSWNKMFLFSTLRQAVLNVFINLMEQGMLSTTAKD